MNSENSERDPGMLSSQPDVGVVLELALSPAGHAI